MSIRRWFPVVLVMSSLLAAALACAPGGAPAAQPEEQAAVEQPAEQVVDPTPTPEPSPTPTETPLPPTPTPEPTETPVPTQAPLTADDVGATAAASEPIVIQAAGESAESIEQAWQQAYELPAGVPFSVTISDAQLEARVAQAMAVSPYGGSSFTNLDVILDNGQVGMTFSFTPSAAAAAGRSLSGSAFFNVTVDAQGEIVVTVASAQVTGTTIGSFSIPPEMLTALNEALTVAFAGTSVQQQAGIPGQVVFTAVTIDDGYATITGYVVPEM